MNYIYHNIKYHHISIDESASGSSLDHRLIISLHNEHKTITYNNNFNAISVAISVDNFAISVDCNFVVTLY